MSTNPHMPVPWVRPPHYIGAPWPDHLVFMNRNRDSDMLTNHNFDTALSRVLAESTFDADDDRSPQVVSENHWAVGWVEWIAIHKQDEGALREAYDLAKALDNYPILDEDRWSEKESEAINEAWAALSIRDRIDLIKREGSISILAARHPWLPSDDSGYLYGVIAGWL